MLSTPFTDDEIRLARAVVATPAEYGLTLPELRACNALIAWDNYSVPMAAAEVRLVHRLLTALANDA